VKVRKLSTAPISLHILCRSDFVLRAWRHCRNSWGQTVCLIMWKQMPRNAVLGLLLIVTDACQRWTDLCLIRSNNFISKSNSNPNLKNDSFKIQILLKSKILSLSLGHG